VVRGDFEKGYRGIDSPAAFLAAYAAPCGASRAAAGDPRQTVKLRYLEYDWALNDRR
jgi:hypothetical protein